MGGKLLALTPKRRRFVEEYRVDWNATQAAIRAGYSPKTAQVQGSQLLSKLMVREALAEVMAEESANSEMSAAEIIAETAKIARLNMFDYMRIGENGEPFVDLSALTRAQAAGLLSFKYKERKDGRGQDARDVCEVEIRISGDKLRALVKLGDRIGLWKPQGPKDDGSGIDVAQLIADQRAMLEKNAEIARLFLPKPKPEKAKVKGG